MQVHILSVPSKGRFPHSEIKISRIHSSNFHIVIVIYPVQNRSKLLNVPNLRDKIILNIVICTKRLVLLLQYFEALFKKDCTLQSLSVMDPGTSAPYIGATNVRFFQYFLSTSSKSVICGVLYFGLVAFL